MTQLVVLIIDDPDDCPSILNAWEDIGVSGVTIFESSGLGRYKRAGMRDDMPLMPSIRDLFGSQEIHHRTLFSVVDDPEKVDEMVRVAQKIIGNLEEGHTGLLFVLPVTKAYGLGKNHNKTGD